jgi:hypothetical protein
MDKSRDAGLIALAVVIVACLTIYFLQVAHPTGSVVEFFFPRL